MIASCFRWEDFVWKKSGNEIFTGLAQVVNNGCKADYVSCDNFGILSKLQNSTNCYLYKFCSFEH